MSDFLNSSENLKIMSQNTNWNYCLLKCVTKVTTCASCHKDSKDFLWFISPWSLSSYQLMVSVWPLQITHHIIELQIFDIWSEWNLTQAQRYPSRSDIILILPLRLTLSIKLLNTTLVPGYVAIHLFIKVLIEFLFGGQRKLEPDVKYCKFINGFDLW